MAKPQRYLPHIDVPGLVQSITFRLRDSVPLETLAAWEGDLRLLERARSNAQHRDQLESKEAEIRERLASYEDAGHGPCWLRDERVAVLVENALMNFDRARYRLSAWCVMPNHVHVLAETLEGYPMPGVIHSWKSFTAKEFGCALPGPEARSLHGALRDQSVNSQERL